MDSNNNDELTDHTMTNEERFDDKITTLIKYSNHLNDVGRLFIA